MRNSFLLICFLCCLSKFSFGQEPRSINYKLQALVIDKNTNEGIPSASVVLYDASGEELLKYGLTNGKGLIIFEKLPKIKEATLLKITHGSYDPIEVKIQSPDVPNVLDLGNIKMKERIREIEEIAINLPPVFMKNDTLIINPAGFKLKENSVVEDLLKKVPGIVVWADGEVTVNGKSIRNVLVDGKPFLGGETIVATRNLPNSAVKNVKVYEKKSLNSDEEGPLEMDILLKKGTGIFGNIGFGYGYNDRREGNLTLNYFNRKQQFSLVAGLNNLNKEANSVAEFLKANIYMAGGNDQTSFMNAVSQVGDNEFKMIGLKVQSYWKPDFSTDMEGYFRRKEAFINQDILEDRYLNGELTQQTFEKSTQNGLQERVFLKGNTKYEFINHMLTFNMDAAHHRNSFENNIDREIVNPITGPLSKLRNRVNQESEGNNLNINVDWNLKKFSDQSVKYQFNYFDDHTEQLKWNRFEDIHVNTTSELLRSRFINSKVFRNNISSSNSLSILRIPILMRFYWDNNVAYKFSKADQIEDNLSPEDQDFLERNSWMSYDESQQEIKWDSKLKYKRSFPKATARWDQLHDFGVNLGVMNFWRNNNSTNSFRDLSKRFVKPVPELFYSYSKNILLKQYRVDLKYLMDYEIPSLNNYVDLIDSANFNFNTVGNRNLVPQTNHKFTLQVNLSGSKSKFKHDFTVDFMLRKNQLLDSVIYGQNGRVLSTKINGEGLPFFTVKYNSTWSGFLLGKTTNAIWRLDYLNNQEYGYQNGVKNFIHSHTISNFLFAQITLNEALKLNLNNGLLISKYKINERNNTYLSNQLKGDIILTYPKGFTWVNNAYLISQKATRFPMNNQVIINSALSYRFLKKEQLEVKASVYDLLKQRSNIKTFLTDNYIRNITTNNLERTFTLGLAYYIRKF